MNKFILQIILTLHISANAFFGTKIINETTGTININDKILVFNTDKIIQNDFGTENCTIVRDNGTFSVQLIYNGLELKCLARYNGNKIYTLQFCNTSLEKLIMYEIASFLQT